MSEDKLFEKYGREVPPKTLLFKDGDTGDEMFIIKSGRVRIFKKIGDVDKTLAVLGAGEFFGEMAIIDGKPRSASAETIEACKLLVINSETFDTMLKSNPEIAVRMIKKLSQRLRETNKQIENLLIKDKNRKVVHVLKSRGEERGEPIAGGLKIPVSVEEIASQSGLDAQEVREVIEKLRKARLISEGDGYFVVQDLKKLDKFLEFLAMKEEFGEM